MTADTLRHDGPLVIGAGLAGLSAALAASPRRVLVVTPAPISEAASSAWAQGGMAAGVDAEDERAHAVDTVAAGAGLVDEAVAEHLTALGDETVHRLASLGVPFDRDVEGRLVRSLEAAHSRPRVARVGGDRAGAAIMAAVGEAAKRADHIDVWDSGRLRRLLTDADGRVRGALVEAGGRLVAITAPSVILATGGIGGLYAVTTNPSALKGEGMGLAALAGAQIADPEFVQFHPTAIDVGRDPAPLATEAIRGEGAVLIDRRGIRFMLERHPLAELAPRDIVARGVYASIAAGRGAFLDATGAIGSKFDQEFPSVFAACMAAGIDPRVRPIPVAPAEHYHMGGIAVHGAGRSTLEGLWAAGECAATGVHGANRLASNSLLEAAAFGAEAGVDARDAESAETAPQRAEAAPDLPSESLRILRQAMSGHAGVVRDGAGLTSLVTLIDRLEEAHGRTPTLVAARLVAQSAFDRRESRGGHYRADFPEALPDARRTFTTLAAALAADPTGIAAE
ncbi:MAG: L-aspartate oxidase [Caulobacteraceae bacterium]|nr:L-aspartate oxidase [Caulobacteraceae bacterium]